MQHQHITFNVQDVGQIWPRIEKEFRSRLPLRNLIWKGGITQTPRFVEQLNVKVTVDGENDGTSDSDSSNKEIMSATMPSLSTNPLLNIYLLETLDTDALDMYKSVIRPRVKNWVSKVTQRKGEEWAIIYLPNAAEVQRMATTTKFLNMRASVFDKLKSDFQTKKDSDHVIMLRPDMIESWNTVFLTLRDRTVQALEERVGNMADEIRRLDSNRMMPGWNYCKFFIVKESLVNMYRLMGLHSEALAQYDELEAVYFELLDSKRLSWFSKFGGTHPGDDFADILNDKKRPYHKQMAESSITMFDFRIYLFGRQCQLLIDMGDYTELISRAQRFVSSFSKSMRESGTGLSLSFVASWTYSICQNIVEICEGIQITQAPVDRSQAHNASTVATTRMLAASKAEFLTNARQQLDILGTLYDRLPPKYLRRSNTCIQLPSPLLRSPSESNKPDSENEKDKQAGDVPKRYGPYADDIDSITNPVLTEALASDERFDQIYVRTCEQATQYYLECGRRRFAQVLRGDIAQLFISREKWQDAARVLAPLIPSTDAKSLGLMDVHLIERMAICEQQLGNTERCLEYVMCLVSHSQYLDRASCNMYTDMLVDLASHLRSPVQVGSGASSLFTVSDINAIDRDDTLCVAATLVSVVPKLIKGLKIEALLIAGSGIEGNQIEVLFDVRDVALEPGANTVHLTTDSVSCPGRFVVRAVTIHMANLAFPIIVSNPNTRKFVRLNEHPTAPVISLRPATVVDSTKPSGVRLSIQAQAVSVDSGMSIRLFDDNGHLLLNSHCAQESDGAASVKDGGMLVVSEAIKANAAVELYIRLNKKYTTMRVTVYAEFQVKGQPRMFLDSYVADFSPRLAISGYVETLAEKHIVVLRAQSCSIDPIRLDALWVAQIPNISDNNDKGLWEQMAVKRGYLQIGDCTTVVREYSAAECDDTIHIQVEASFVTVLDIVCKMVCDKLDQLALKHGVSQHKRYIERLATAHIRATIDEAATAREKKLVCEPLVPLWAATSAYGTAELQKSMRQLFHELSEALVDGKLTDGGSSSNNSNNGSDAERLGHMLRVELALGVTRKYAAASMSLGDERSCHVYEPAPLAVSISLKVAAGPDAEDRRHTTDNKLLVTLVPREPEKWLIAGPVSREITLDKESGRAIMKYTLVPLEVGYLRLPEVICHEEIIGKEDRPSDSHETNNKNDKETADSLGSKYQRLKTVLVDTQTTACVLASSTVATMYTVPISAAESPVGTAVASRTTASMTFI
ncbi:hypothetical protein IW140_001845 [Coemansia sp. RSA 1813]|nr:hypothetical protein EV178_002523 [Coemansia sp. RSA 1646]KAJ1772415.1 hypothetical protein LPJ74_001505 [Coemansia sp. RSA 1843]KAJ2091137.1 hypothetical protein IW138_002099 [Coemansia sp. RSA 986]KAJ2213610.1 hypothetical protein EV179_003726 [Coemansia sp. RSA 487]KAJ2571142.1 hypothetical protein IW140_001845 [Coemansia sp. RSA 1813]